MFFTILLLLLIALVLQRYLAWRKAHGGDYNANYEGFAESLRFEAAWVLREGIELCRNGVSHGRNLYEQYRNRSSRGNSSGGYSAVRLQTQAQSGHRFLFDDVDSNARFDSSLDLDADLELDLDLEQGATPYKNYSISNKNTGMAAATTTTTTTTTTATTTAIATTAPEASLDAKQKLLLLFDEQNPADEELVRL
ncbi:UNVERIFIED_CONTAM: hypothetical protein HDU68_007567 [Siphonaria sp. JEL0065]|nr:hypothetical protein HDU68_007567 [Siphonaria sp. JEL0065]